MCNYFRNIEPMKIEALHGITTALDRNETKHEESDEVFHWTDYPRVGARLKIILESGAEGMFYVSLHLFPLDGTVVPPPEILPIPTVSYLLRDRESPADGPTQNVVRSTHAELGYGVFNYDMMFQCLLCPKDLLYSSVYNTGDAVELQVFVESPAAAGAFHSQDGTLQWTIESWSRVRENLLDRFVNSHRSPYFYTHEGGYRVQAWLSIVPVVDRAENVVVDIVFLTGLDDNRLTKSFPHSTTVTLKNPRHPDQSVVSRSVERERARRYQLVFPGERVPFDRLLADDSFLLEVVIRAK